MAVVASGGFNVLLRTLAVWELAAVFCLSSWTGPWSNSPNGASGVKDSVEKREGIKACTAIGHK